LLLACPMLRSTSEQEPIPHHLVNLETAIPSLHLDIRYATEENFTGRVLYPFPDAYLHRDAAEALAAVQSDLRQAGLALKVFDGYRPLSVQQAMWDLIQDERYVSNPAVNRGRHTRGTAVDVTLIDLEGNELPMPTDYDDFSERAHSDAEDVTPEQKRYRWLLRKAMMRHGFQSYPYEWWHFDYRGWEGYPVLDIDFESLRAGVETAVPQ